MEAFISSEVAVVSAATLPATRPLPQPLADWPTWRRESSEAQLQRGSGSRRRGKQPVRRLNPLGEYEYDNGTLLCSLLGMKQRRVYTALQKPKCGIYTSKYPNTHHENVREEKQH